MSRTVDNYIEYAKERGRWWGRKYPYLYDDIIASALFALVKAFKRKDIINVKGYITRCVDNEVAGLIRSNDLIKIPKNEIKRRKDGNLGFADLPKVISYMEAHEGLRDLKRSKEHPTWKHLHVEDVKELLELTEYEEQIIRLRIYGYSLNEIGIELDRAKSSLSETLSNIKGRYLRLLRNHRGLLDPEAYDE